MVQQETTFFTSRVFAMPLDRLYEAYRNPELLQLRRWPKGFTNEFTLCETKVGGEWNYTMIGSNRARHPNQSIFTEFTKEKIVIDHISKPHYILTITLQEEWAGTRMTRQQQFDTPEIYMQIKDFVSNANEENFDRLEALLEKSM